MTIKDWCVLAMLISGIGCATFNYQIFWQSRRDIYEGDAGRAETAMKWSAVAFHVFLIASACWAACVVKGIA